MNARERFLNTVLGRKVDRFYRYEHGPWPSTQKAWESQGLPTGIDFNEYFEFDKLPRLPVRTGYVDSPFCPLMERKVIEKTLNWAIIKDSDGITKKVLNIDPDLSMPQFLKFPVENREDWKRIRKHLEPSRVAGLVKELDSTYPGLDEGRDFPITLTACGAFGHPRNLFGDTLLCYTFYDDPGLIHEVLGNWLDIYKAVLFEASRRVRIDCFLIWEDMCYKNGPLVSPQLFREFLLPYYIELVGYARKCGVSSVWVDTDGDMLKLLPLFLEAGVDAFMPFEVQAGMDIVQIRKQSKDMFTIVGGIDKRALAEGKEEIRNEVDRVMPFFLDTGRYIPCLDHTVPINVSLDNFRYYIEYLRSYEAKSGLA